jgi:hypothetical protein
MDRIQIFMLHNPQTASSPRFAASPTANPLNGSGSNLAEVGAGLQKAKSVLFGIVLIATILGFIYLGQEDPSAGAAFSLIGLGALIAVRLDHQPKVPGLPFASLLGLQHFVVYGLPLVVKNPVVGDYPQDQLIITGTSVFLFLMAVGIGNQLGTRWCGLPKISRMNLDAMGGQSSRLLPISAGLLVVNLIFTYLTTSGLYWQMFASFGSGLLALLRNVFGAAVFAGSFLGAFSLAKEPSKGWAKIFWLLILLNFLILSTGILLSASSVMALSVLAGSVLGASKLPWKFLVIACSLLGFLNFSKFVMRERYWVDGGSPNVGLTEIPAFYTEWATATLDILQSRQTGFDAGGTTTDDGQSLLMRVNNLQNLQFIIKSQSEGYENLWGKTYTLIPMLLIPRVVWSGKPTTHEGQILLNLHFGRQMTVEQTQTTYIAWGLLPEAVGNFGIVGGALGVGAGIGFVLGWIKRRTSQKQFLSVAGICTGAAFLVLGASYEQVASVLITSLFQMLVSVAAGATLLRFILIGKAKSQGLDL